ncbi:MAG: transglutaminase domain-containing protein [Candidatus Heimdallarchaeota archaeon]|nr:MAG: transglutaminase domain-containing protein [Candidatus Heimdallarchaeota archaeon]
MSTERLEKDPAPAAIRYLVLTSAFTCLFTGLSFVLARVGTSTQEDQFYQTAMTGFTLVFAMTMVEWFLLRRSRRLIGPYGFAFVLEIIKYLLFGFATAQYIEAVPRVSASPFFLHQILSLGIVFLLALTKIARTRIDQLAQKDISRNVLNLLPTVLILVVFLGTYVTEIVGLGTPRQRIEFEDYEKKNIDWSLFHTPTWDATYLLENLLDQFTAGIQNPYKALFNVSNELGADPTSPPAYWRVGSLETYELHDKGEDPTTRWTSVDPLGYRILTPSSESEGTSYSSDIDPSDRIAEFKVEVPLDYSTASADVSVNPNFPNYLPSPWNGKSGAYIDENSFVLYDSNDRRINTLTTQTKEVYPGGYSDSFDDLLGIQAYITTGENSAKEGVFEYTINYKDISETLYDAALFSKTKDDYQSILGSSDWIDIRDLYLQYPNTSSELPSDAYVYGTGPGVTPDYYRDWAPEVVASTIDQCTIPGQSVFSQAYTEMQRLAPNYYINTNEDVAAELGGTLQSDPDRIPVPGSTGEFELAFDFDMWLGEYATIAAMTGEDEYDMPHPEPYEDYNEWFINNKQGTALHFASLFVTMMRLRGIPSRVVIGYLGGSESTDKTKLVITNMMLHAWAEVLIPIEEIIPGLPPTIERRTEWVSFDPLLKFLSDILQTGTPIDMPVMSEVSTTVLIGSDYDHRAFGPATAPIANITTTDDSDQTLNLVQDNITLSARLMMVTGVSTWMPWQPACDYLGTRMSFYWSNTRTFSDDSRYFIGNSTIDSAGYGSVQFDYDILDYGSPIWFFARVVFNPGATDQHIAGARSLRHEI